MTTHETQLNSAITIRRMDLTDADRERGRKARGAATPRDTLDGPVLGVEVEGRLLAAIAVATGDVIADPFSRTERAAGAARSCAPLSSRAPRRPPARAAASRRVDRPPAGPPPPLGGSPAGQIITLPRACRGRLSV